MHKITPYLWFDKEAEEAAKFYVSVFKNSKINKISRYGSEFTDVTGQLEGTVLTVELEVDGQPLMLLNGGDGGPRFKFTEAFSLMVSCDSQAEADEYWYKLTADGGEESMCGWLKDKYGLSWQITPTRLMELLNDPDKERAGRATNAMLEMKRIDIAALERAANGG